MKPVLLSLGLILALLPTSAPAAPEPAPPEDSRAVLSRPRSLDGTWVGASTRGWKSQISIETIARGSAVVSLSRFEHQLDPFNGHVPL